MCREYIKQFSTNKLHISSNIDIWRITSSSLKYLPLRITKSSDLEGSIPRWRKIVQFHTNFYHLFWSKTMKSLTLNLNRFLTNLSIIISRKQWSSTTLRNRHILLKRYILDSQCSILLLPLLFSTTTTSFLTMTSTIFVSI